MRFCETTNPKPKTLNLQNVKHVKINQIPCSWEDETTHFLKKKKQKQNAIHSDILLHHRHSKQPPGELTIQADKKLCCK